MSDQIFISYRRNDAAYVTGYINDLLRKEFGDEAVFTDVDNIALGVDFRAVIDETVSQCQVFLAVIGSEWLNARDQEGKHRLKNPGDFVRIEIESALKRNIPVIPLLVSGAKMPAAEDLPESIRDLAYRNGTPIRPAPDFTADMARLIRNLRNHFDKIRTARGEPPTDVARKAPVLADKTRQAADTQAESEQEQSAGMQLRVADDDSARRRAELGIGGHKKRRWATPLWAIAIILGAGAGWYYTDQNPETLQDFLSAVRPGSPGSEAVSDAVPGPADSAITAGDADTDSAAGGAQQPGLTNLDGAPADSSIPDVAKATIANALDIDSTAAADVGDALLENAAERFDDVPEVAVAMAESIVAESPDDGIEPAATADDSGDTRAVSSNVDFEVTLTPESQRQSDASGLISDGVRFAGVGDHEAAILSFSEALTLDIEPAFVYKQRGASYQALGQYDLAIGDYGRAIELNREDLISFYNRGVSHMALEDHAAATADFDVVIQLDPEFVDAYSRRADAHEATGNTAAAARDRAVVQVFQSNQSNQSN